MGLKLGTTAISDIKLGTNQIYKAYQGSSVVWDSGITPPTPTIRALKFESSGAQTLGVDTTKLGTISPNFEYSTDGGSTWTTWDVRNNTLSFGNGTDLYVRGSNNVLAKGGVNYVQFVFTTNSLVACTGNLMHLYDYTQDLTAFPKLDSNSRGVKFMFRNCSVLTTPPSLPATDLEDFAYYSTFEGCTSLNALPVLPATTLTSECYTSMFEGCTNIKISLTQTGEYTNEYVFGTTPSGAANSNKMFANTGGTFTGSPYTQTLYTSNTIIS